MSPSQIHSSSSASRQVKILSSSSASSAITRPVADLLAPRAGGVGQDERVAPVGLRLARVEVRRTAHHKAGHVGLRDLALSRDGQYELCDRPRLVDYQPRDAVPAGPLQQGLDVRRQRPHGPHPRQGRTDQRLYDLCHAALSLWLSAGGDPAQIAARAENTNRNKSERRPPYVRGFRTLGPPSAHKSRRPQAIRAAYRETFSQLKAIL